MGAYNTTGVLKGPSGPAAAKAEEASPDIVVTAAQISKLDALQMLLDVIGLVPGFGAPADIVNAIISGARGDWLGAGLSLFGVVPVAGEAATAGKIAKNADRYAAGVAKVADEILPHLPASVQDKLRPAIEAAKKKIDELAGRKPKKEPEPPPKAKDEGTDGKKVRRRDCKHLEKGPPGAKHQGGKHGKVKKDSQRLVRESHHVPPSSVTQHPVESGPAISMDYADHRDMSSTGRKRTHPTSLAQSALAKSGPAGYFAAMLTEITEIRQKFPGKYDAAIAWMLLYAACMGYIPS